MKKELKILFYFIFDHYTKLKFIITMIKMGKCH